jgi:hypothetical protein
MMIKIMLDDKSHIFAGMLPEELRLDPSAFEKMWCLHPELYHKIKMRGKIVPTPRWQQSYMVDYQYSGTTNKAL